MDIISLTAIPSRFKHMEPCVTSLCKQGLPVCIFLPRYFKRKNKEVTSKDIPSYIKECDTVVLTEDEGSITKLKPALRLQGIDRIITADDDIEYPDGWAANLLNYSNEYPDSVIAHRGRLMKDRKLYRQNKVVEKPGSPVKVNFITGVSGVLYRPEFFTQEFIDNTEFSITDDINISVELNRNKINMLVVPPPKGEIVTMRSNRVDALCSINVKRTKTSNNDKELKKQGFWEVAASV